MITGNYVRTVNDKDNFGPFMMYVTSGQAPYDGNPLWFIHVFENSTVSNNIFFNASSSQGFSVVMAHGYFPITTTRPHGNIFTGNRFVAGNNGSPIGACSFILDNGYNANTAQLIANNTWTANTLTCPATPTLTLPGNTTANANIDPQQPTTL